MAQVPSNIDTPSEPAESLSHEQEGLVSGMNQLNVLGDSTEACQCDSTEPPHAIGKKPGDKPGAVGSEDIPESYEIIHSITSDAREIDSSWSIIDQENESMSENESIRGITFITSDLPMTGGEESGETQLAETMNNTTDGRPLAAVQPSVFRGPDSSLTSEPSEHSIQLQNEGNSTSGPGQEDGARSQDVQSEDGRVTSISASSPKQEIDILLIGKTGHGKSSTGNSILKRQEFKTSNRSTSATYDVHEAWTDIDDYVVKVIDGPGVAETRLESAEAAQKACDDMAKAMLMCPKGFHALLLVLKFGERFTKEEEDCVAMLKSIFGQNIVRDYCVIVVTHGELFDMEDDCDDFSDWLAEQEGALKKLFIECSYRCILMRNKTKDNKIKEAQLRELVETLHTMKYREIRYTNELFASVQQERNRLVVEVKAPQLKEEIMRDTNLIVSDLTKLKNNNDDLDETDTILLRMEERVKDLLERIAAEDNQTGVLKDLKDTVSSMQESINIEKAINKQRKEDRKIQDQLIREHEENIAKLKLQHAEEQTKLEEQLRTASDAEKGELQEKLVAISKANDEKMEQLNSIFNQKMDEAKREEAEKWQNVLDETREEHNQQMEALQSQYLSMKERNAEAMKNMQAVSEQLARLQRTKPPPKDPTKVTLHCKDQEGRIVSVTIPKTSPIGPLMQSYYGMSGYPPQVIKFCFDGKPVLADQTPSGLQLEEDDMIEAFYEQTGGISYHP